MAARKSDTDPDAVTGEVDLSELNRRLADEAAAATTAEARAAAAKRSSEPAD